MKRAVCLLLALLVVAVFAPTALAQEPIAIFVNGLEVVTDVPAQIVDDRTMVPVRFVSEALGATVTWDAETRTAIIEEPGFTGVSDPLTVGAGELPGIKVMVNGELVESDVPAQIIDDRTMVPVRFVSEELGATVEWDGVTRTVYITQYAPGAMVPYVSELGFSLERPADWLFFESDDTVILEAPLSPLSPLSVHLRAFGADPFVKPELLSSFFVEALAVTLGGDADVTPVSAPGEAAPVGAYEVTCYEEFTLSFSDGTERYLEQWGLKERGWTFLITVLSETPRDSADPELQLYFEVADAILASFAVTVDSELAYETHEFSGMEVELPATFEQYLDMDEMAGFGNNTGTAVVVGQESTRVGVTVDEVLNKVRLNLLTTYQELITVDETRKLSIDSKPAGVVEYELDMGRLVVYGEEYIVLLDDTVYSINFSLLDSHKDDPDIRSAIQAVLDSISFIE